jgi:hypothetical protein
MPEYRVNPEVLRKLRIYIGEIPAKARETERVSAGSETYTWDQVLEQVEKGTPFGIRYAKAIEEGLRESGEL